MCAILEACGARATAVSTDPVPPLYAFIAGVERFRTDPDPAETYDLLVLVDCGSADRVGAVAQRHPELFSTLPRVIIDHHASNADGGAADWIEPGSAATCEMVTLLAARLGVPLDAGDGALAAALMAGIVMDTATFAHPNATPRTLAVSSALVAAGAPLSDISRRLYRTKPDAQLRLFGRVLDRLQTSPDGRVVWSTLTNADYPATGSIRAHSEGIIDLLAQSDTAEVAMLLKEGEDDGHAPVGAHEARRRGRDGADGRVRRRRSRPRRRRLAAAADGRGGDRGPRRGRAPRGRGQPVRRGDRSGGLDGVLVVAKPSGPTSHDVVGLVRRLSQTRRVGHGGHARPVRGRRPAGVPRPRHPPRRVPPRRDQALPGDDLLRRHLDDRRHRRRADAGRRAAR